MMSRRSIPALTTTLLLAATVPGPAASADKSADDIFWVVELTINDGMDAEFKALTEAMTQASAKRPGVKTYKWLRDGNKVHEIERYENAAAVTEGLKGFGAFADRYFKVFTLSGFSVCGPVPDDLKPARAGFGPEYFDPAGGFAR